MLYKCENCDYSSSIKGSFLKHQQRKTPCKKKATATLPLPSPEESQAPDDKIWEQNFIDDIVEKLFIDIRKYYSNYLDYLEQHFKETLIENKEFRNEIYPFNDPEKMMLLYNIYQERQSQNS